MRVRRLISSYVAKYYRTDSLKFLDIYYKPQPPITAINTKQKPTLFPPALFPKLSSPSSVLQLLQLSTVRFFSIRDFMDHENGVVAVEMLSKDFDPTAVVTEPLPPVVTSTADCDLVGKLAEDHKGTREKQMVLGRNVHTTCLAVMEPEPNDEFTGDKDAYMASVLARYRKTLVERTKHHLGYPYNLDFDYGALAQLQHFSINNLGDPFIESNYGVHSRQFEVGVLDWFARLWEIEKNEYWG